ncbi:alpha/beta hydrolase [Microcoleus sp. FACHB-1515]|uniref:alpha/beta fold hydrolase n=1 Tax=Cyanophyceae TaxID=3028117 RepID=UPI001688AEB3|nr:alpha/beta hydrolase [Microcoleus sp. FACHB-1515]MBD2088687.1 alpha/beta hydrolase [Microcoleus sp. FACHB-1515]
MAFLPLDLLFRWLSGLFSIALIAGGIYILRLCYSGELINFPVDTWRERLWLIAGWGLLVWSIVGFLPIALLRRFGRDEPKMYRTVDATRISRPDGSEIHVEFYGSPDAPPLILTHGWGPNSMVWYYAKKQLGDRYRLILWDLPGLGKSTKPNNRDYSLEKYARDLEAVLGLVERPAVLLGHSMGGMILLTFCRLFPEQLGSRVAGLILVDTTYTNPLKTAIASPLLTALQKPLIEPLLHLTHWLAPIVWLLSGLGYLNGSMYLTTEISGFTGRETRGQLDFATRLGLMGNPGILVRGVMAMLHYDETATLPNIPIPVQVIVGRTDIATRFSAHQYMAEKIPDAELIVLRPAGHMGLVERNMQFAEAVRSFPIA